MISKWSSWMISKWSLWEGVGQFIMLPLPRLSSLLLSLNRVLGMGGGDGAGDESSMGSGWPWLFLSLCSWWYHRWRVAWVPFFFACGHPPFWTFFRFTGITLWISATPILFFLISLSLPLPWQSLSGVALTPTAYRYLLSYHQFMIHYLLFS